MSAPKGPRTTLRLDRDVHKDASPPKRATAYAAVSSDEKSETDTSDAGSPHTRQFGGRMRVESISDGEDGTTRAESGIGSDTEHSTLPSSDAEEETKKVNVSGGGGRMAAAVVSGLDDEKENEESSDAAASETIADMQEATASPSQVGASFFGEESM